MYDAARNTTKFRMIGGVAFVRFGLSCTCDPGSYKANETLPASTLPEVKVKILGFHGFTTDGDSITTATISSGHNRDTLFDDDDESRKLDRLNEDLKDLKCLTRGVDIGAESCSMENMSCIGYDANSPYAKMNPNAQPKDNWWSHFYLNYAQDDSTVAHSTVAIMGCYLDLNQRTSARLKNTYAKDCVNVYIPTDTYGCIHKQMTEVSEFNAFAQGGEIIDHTQGLTSLG